MDHKRIYNALIYRAQQRKLSGYFERHHILPRCLGGAEDQNIVHLTPEEHYLCHLLLVKIYPGNSKLIAAAMFMCGGSRRYNNKVYGWLKRKWSDFMKSDHNPQKRNPMRGKNHPHYGKDMRNRITEEGRRRISEFKKSNNPNKGIAPWAHPRATRETKKIWASADLYYEWWKLTKKSYSVMAKEFGFETYKSPHMNLIKKFRLGWIPTEDQKWIEFKKCL